MVSEKLYPAVHISSADCVSMVETLFLEHTGKFIAYLYKVSSSSIFHMEKFPATHDICFPIVAIWWYNIWLHVFKLTQVVVVNASGGSHVCYSSWMLSHLLSNDTDLTDIIIICDPICENHPFGHILHGVLLLNITDWYFIFH